MITPDPSLFGCNSTLLPNFLPCNLDWRPKSFFTLTHPDASAEPCSLTIKRGTILSTACCLCWCQHPTSATQNIPKLRLSTINYAQKIAHFAPFQQNTPEYKVYCPSIRSLKSTYSNFKSWNNKSARIFNALAAKPTLFTWTWNDALMGQKMHPSLKKNLVHWQ